MHNFTDLSHEEQDEILRANDEYEREQEEIRLLKELYETSLKMISLECNGGKEYTKARINYKGVLQKLLIFHEVDMTA